MKKLLSVIMAAVLTATCATGLAVTASVMADDSSAPAAVSETASVYLVPGSYVDYQGDGEKHMNAIAGATKLSEAEVSALHMEGDIYKAGAAGTALPEATTTQKDRTGTLYTFNGWWTIVDAEVTYFTEVPAVEETTYLYADFRAALSQSRDPINPDAGAETTLPRHYMKVTRAETGKVEYIPLLVSGTDVANAVQAGYGGPVQFYNEWFTLEPGDLVSYYFTGVYGATATAAPRPGGSPRMCAITMESSGAYGATAAYMVSVNPDAPRSNVFFNCYTKNEAPVLSYTGAAATKAYIFRCYIKFYDQGGTMTLYMENLSLKMGVEA